MKTILLSVWDF